MVSLSCFLPQIHRAQSRKELSECLTKTLASTPDMHVYIHVYKLYQSHYRQTPSPLFVLSGEARWIKYVWTHKMLQNRYRHNLIYMLYMYACIVYSEFCGTFMSEYENTRSTSTRIISKWTFTNVKGLSAFKQIALKLNHVDATRNLSNLLVRP